jgi:hypothetical protein
MTPQEQLNADACEYADEYYIKEKDKQPWLDTKMSYEAGALSPTAANGCNKRVEIAKIEFAIKQLYWLNALVTFDNPVKQDIYKQVNELEQQINNLKKQQ